ncbi:MAG TPA: ArsC/Spx/MgsR family protein, partial [Telluria sp.]
TDKASALELMLEFPSVVKRPVLLDREQNVHVGFSDDKYREIFKA